MKAGVVKMTPKMAMGLLEKNTKNRKISDLRVKEYRDAMLNGEWKENGESIIMDKNFVLKDGQHRLYAIIEANKAYDMVLVTDVEPEIMQTIDVGKGRSLSDVLTLNGVKSAGLAAGITKAILAYKKGTYTKKVSITNAQGVDFYFKNADDIDELTAISSKIYARQIDKIISPVAIGLYHYVISGYNHNPAANDFLNLLSGVVVRPKSAATWVFKKMSNAKINKITLSKKWRLAMCIKAWNVFIDGDYPVKYMNYDVESPLPKVESKQP